MATIAEVAAKAGVGVGTVSRVLNNHPNISAKTRSRVMAAIRELDFRPNQLAQGLSKGQTHTVGVIVPFFTQPSSVERLRGISETLRDSGYDLVLFGVETVTQRQEHVRNLARRGRVDGLLVISLVPDDKEVERFKAAGIPVVLIDAAHAALPHMVIDDLQGGYLATRHLLDLGHQRIAFVGDSPDNPFGFSSSRNRQQGFLKGLREAGLEPAPEYIKAGPHGRHVAHRLTAELLSLPEPPTAVFAASDTQALGVLEAAQQQGLSVPHDLSIIGFDDIDVAPYVGLTTVRQPLRESGVRGVELMLSALRGRDSGPIREIMPLDLVVRKTTAPAKGRLA